MPGGSSTWVSCGSLSLQGLTVVAMAMATMLSVMDAKTTAATWYMVDKPRGLVKKVVLVRHPAPHN